MELGLQKKRALITGGSRGIGAAIARTLSEEGCDVILVARSEDGLTETATEIRNATDGEVSTVVCDTSDPAAITSLATRFSEIDILVNNAGAVPAGQLDELTTEGIRAGWDAKVFGYMKMMECFYPTMRERQSGVIVNVVGMAGLRVNADVIGLTGGNAALIAMTKALGAQAAQQNVRVVGVNPSATSTERAVTLWKDKARRELGDENRWSELLSELPFGRAAAPEDIANMVTFLASSRASYVTGSFVNVDGGQGSRP